jgi:hypothetical protein
MNKDKIILAEICQSMSDKFVMELDKIYRDYCQKNATNEITPMFPVALAQAAGWMLSAWATNTQYPRTQLLKEFEAMIKQAAKDQLEFEQGEKDKKIIN